MRLRRSHKQDLKSGVIVQGSAAECRRINMIKLIQMNIGQALATYIILSNMSSDTEGWGDTHSSKKAPAPEHRLVPHAPVFSSGAAPKLERHSLSA